MNWHDVNPLDPELDVIAAQHGFHPLHVEDCRSDVQRAKVETGDGYLFVVLKLTVLRADNELTVTDLDMFVGPDFLVTIHRDTVSVLSALHSRADQLRPDEGLYRVMDAVVDSYYPLLEEVEDRIDPLEEEVLRQPLPALLERVAEARTSLPELRCVLSNTRQISHTLQRDDTELIHSDLLPFLAGHPRPSGARPGYGRTGAGPVGGLLDLYQSSVANQNNEATRLLTVLGTLALPSWMSSGYTFAVVLVLIVCSRAVIFRRDGRLNACRTLYSVTS